jgi:hypothetical protein
MKTAKVHKNSFFKAICTHSLCVYLWRLLHPLCPLLLEFAGRWAEVPWYSTNTATDSVVDILHGEYFEGPVREGRWEVLVLFEIS